MLYAVAKIAIAGGISLAELSININTIMYLKVIKYIYT